MTAQNAAPVQDIAHSRMMMVECQVRTWEVLDPRVLEVMTNVPRERFVPDAYKGLAFSEANIPLDHGQMMMQPKVEGRVLQAVNIQPGESVLEVGTGSGYLAACMAELGGQILSVDCFENFVRDAESVWKDLGFKQLRAQQENAASLEWTNERYDVIVVTGSMPDLHDSFRQHLSVGGRLFVVTGKAPVMQAQLMTRVGEDDWSREFLFETNLPPLIDAYEDRQFQF
ncbi:protein-L-isoaspartate(D-aspartate) O-methyltransferase [Natronospira proteinivora]|uniref:Protein-L-isoaspartate O-methyltransferase n=1 Tax=Natronospira proteinivora TaxID=1807133 RepID=A0ABT1GBH5_9GAMM|nr:protein-L-isoaspartate O-methyltransferase [Natronospira proteinivora]MCP1728634.1 protein-L-isoaspartate(D-aspartate) O-methyltransferase [Natronospira proteinivora]